MKELIELYDRTYRNCMFYKENGKREHLLNEICVLRGIVYCIEAASEEKNAFVYVDFEKFSLMIEEQNRLLGK